MQKPLNLQNSDFVFFFFADAKAFDPVNLKNTSGQFL